MRTVIAVIFAVFGLSSLGQEDRKIDVKYHDCMADGQTANMSGYQSMTKEFVCKEGRISIGGKWGEDIQNGYSYSTEFGEPVREPQYIADLPLELQMPKWQKWCKTKYGWTLCGWNEEEHKREVEHDRVMSRIAPPYKKP